MRHDRPVKFLAGAAAFAPLKILDRIRSMSHRLQGGELMHPRLFQFRYALPIGHTGRAFHQQERRFFDRSHQIVIHGGIHGNLDVRFFVPGRIIVPGHDIYRILELEVVESVVVVHEIGRRRKFRAVRLHCGDFMLHEIQGLIRHKPPPIQIHAVYRIFPMRGRRLDLRPVGIRVAPERGPPLFVQVIERAVLALQPLPESLLA
ncbi:hypothetical protein D1872_250100 [compost metagenome]